MAEQQKKKPVRRRRKGDGEGGGFLPLLFIALAAIALFNHQVSILIAAGLVPTIVLAITGKGENKSAKLQCVSFTNMMAVVTMVPDVWSRPSSMMGVISEPMNLLIMWGGAAFGYALIYVGPQVAAMILQGLAQDRIKKIIAQKQAIVELWGHEVMGEKKEDTADTGNFIRRPPSN